MKLKKFSALLRYPDYAAPEWPYEMYTIAVEARSHVQAAKTAQDKAFKAINKEDADMINDPDDLEVVCVIAGPHKFYIPM